MNKYFHGFLFGVSVLPALLIMPAMATTTINAGETLNVTDGASGQNLDGQPIDKANKTHTNITHTGIWRNNGILNICEGLTFSGNYAPVAGGVVYNSGILNIGDGVIFENNRSLTDGLSISGASEMGAAIYSEGTANAQRIINIGNNVEFNNNIAYAGAALYLFGNNEVTIGNNVVFADNKNYTYDFGVYGVFIGQSGAINITQGDGYENGYVNLTIGDGAQFLRNRGSDGASININSSGNTVTIGENALFQDNDGAAIFNWDSTLTIGSGAIFDGNSKYDIEAVQTAGGLVNYGTDSVANLISATFVSNTGGLKGGAIYNDGELTLNGNSMFGGETADLGNVAGNGGAIYNTGEATINGATFNNNIANGDWVKTDTIDYKGGGAIFVNGLEAVATIKNAQFENNSATGQYGMGGAIYVFSGTADIENSTFDNNTATYGGAIYTRNKTAVSDLIVKKSTFVNNSAEEVGAIGIIRLGDFSETRFANNHATSEDSASDGSGAVFVGAEATAIFDDVEFESNDSGARGGALGTRSFGQGVNAVATLDIINSSFTTNTAATNGGAIDNYLYGSDTVAGSVYVANTTFDRNNAANGGAVYNHIGQVGDRLTDNTVQNEQSDVSKIQVANMYFSDVTFTGNIATTNGGAVYNEGIMTFAGTNTFSGNKANNVANDIHNVGDVTVASGTTTIDGGITGTGSLTIANGAILNIGTASLNQCSITLNGTMLATLRDGDAQITADNFGGEGTLKLSFSDEGTYHVFGGSTFRAAGIDVISSLYDIDWINEDRDLVATMKSVEDIAADNGIATDTAVAVAGMSQSSSEKLNDLGVQIQEKLAEGTPEAKQEVEHITKAIHPETESVIQSTTVSIQHTIANLTSARMAAPRFGRNGGDVNFTSSGVWVQGLFNKSRQKDAFHGYTRGVAAGIDGTINKVFTLGAGYSYAHSDVTGTERNTEIDSNTVFVYGQYKPSRWYLNTMLNYTMSDFTDDGTVMGTPVSGNYDVDAFGGVVATGYDFTSGLTPELGVRYMHVKSDGYTNSMDIETKAKDMDFLTGVFGTKYSFNVNMDRYTKLIPQLNIAAKYDILSDRNMATVTIPGVDSYTLQGERLSRFGGEFGIGLGIKHRSVDFSINYDIDVRKDYISQTGMVRFRINF